jgi:Flp pilus assembly protein TadD
MILLISGAGGCAKKGARDFPSLGNIFKQDPYEKLLERQQASVPPELDAGRKLPEMTEADHERLGDRYFNEGKLEMAFLQYSKILRKNPDNAVVLCKRGMVFLRKGMNDSAMQDFQTVLRKDSTHAAAHQGMGQAYFKIKNYGEAEKHFQEAVKSNPRLWASYNFLGIMYDYQQQHEKAVASYNAAISARQDEASLFNNLGVSYALMGQNEKAVEAFRQGLSISPRDRKIGNNLGMVLCKLGRHFEAIEAFKTSGDEAQAYNNLGCFYLEEGEFERAIRAFERAIQLRQDHYAQASDNLRKAESALHAAMGASGPEGRRVNRRTGPGASLEGPGSMQIEIKEAPLPEVTP